MGDKYKIKKSDLRALFATADMLMENRYHALYKQLGWERGPNGNFHCWNTSAHRGGTDANASLSVDNKSGLWHCFSCGIKGNFQSYFSNYLKGGRYGNSYTDFIIDFLNMSSSIQFSTEAGDPDYERNSKEMQVLYDQLQNEKLKERGRPWILSGELTDMIKEATSLPMSELDDLVNNLLNNKVGLDYLFDTRRITIDLIKKYRIGMNNRGKFIFPIIGADGSLINIKAYDPRGNPDYKWTFTHTGLKYGPIPINHFTHQKLYFFGGEPDTYCAIAFGIDDAVTFGSESMTNVDEIFGPERARQLFLGKECVICLDADEAGVVSAKKLAESLYPYAKQIKIIDLNKSDINPYGLDPNLVKEVEKNGKKKLKRIEKDFTDFVRKNGFDKTARMKFDELIENTTVYTQNIDRVKKEIFKVTLQESRMPRYYSADGDKILELMASVSDFNCKALMYPTQFRVSCKAMCNPDRLGSPCKNCKLATMPGFSDSPYLTINFVREIKKEFSTDPFYIKITEHDILGLVEVTDNQKIQQQKKLCHINENCKFVVIQDCKQEKLLHVRLAKDINEYGDPTVSGSGSADIDVEAYMAGENDIYPNRSYKFEAVQTTAWNGQHAVLFIHKAEAVATCTETFKMDQQTYDILQVFKPKGNEIIKDHLKRRYDIFANAAGVTGKRDMFFLNDLAFFSPLIINNRKLLPEVTRGWVEVLIAGDTRTCKTMIARWLRNHYKLGDIIVGSTAVSRSGLLGGIMFNQKKPSISWGKIPMNDGGLIIIDELSNINEVVLNDMTGCRSEGIVYIDGIASGKVLGRVRKIVLSNQRTWKSENQKSHIYGIDFLKDLCLKDEILARFDIAFVVRKGDVAAGKFAASYAPLTSEFTELQCQTAMRWTHSRTSDQIIFEDGFEDAVNEAQIQLINKYHSSTQLVNQEMRAKLVRMSCSLAAMLTSMPRDDWNKLLVKKEHLQFMVEFINELYDHKNMNLDQYSERKRQTESLGQMAFMENICKYIDVNQILNDDEFAEKHIQQIFYDYLERVQNGKLYIPDARDDKTLTTRQRTYECVPKLLGILISRNCFLRTKKGTYRKTVQFNDWLAKRMEMGNEAPTSNILEPVEDKQGSNIIEAAQRFNSAG